MRRSLALSGEEMLAWQRAVQTRLLESLGQVKAFQAMSRYTPLHTVTRCRRGCSRVWGK